MPACVKSTQPDIVQIVRGAFADAWPIMRSRIFVYGVLATVSALAGLSVPFVHLADGNAQEQWQVQMAVQPANVLGAVAVFFALPAVLRTVRPEFRMTFIRILGMIGIGIAIGVVSEVGLFFLIVPGVLMFVKWSQATWAYLLGDGKNPFGESWEITTGHFWETLGFFFLLELVVTVLLIGFFLPAAIAIFVPVLSVVLAPIAFLAYVFASHVSLLGQMRWMLELRRLNLPGVMAASTAP
jgi:hypothetical protein